MHNERDDDIEKNDVKNEAKDSEINKTMNPRQNNDQNNDNNRRKRINRMKTAILLIIIILLILPSICCILLLARVSRLEKQVNQISATYGLNKNINNEDNMYAFAAEKLNTDLYVTPEAVESDKDNTAAVTQPAQSNTIPDTIKEKNKKVVTESKNKNKRGIYEGKKVYLTFDDGPSIYTSKILDILDQYHVKATFFVIGKTDSESLDLYKRIVDEGHTLGMHSYSHQYDKLYNSVEDFDKDFTKLRNLLYDTTGYKPTIYRFPGGSDNQVNANGMEKFVKYLNKKHIVYYDWNVVNGDATNIVYSQKQLVSNVLNGIKNKKRAIVLLHDTQTKVTTVESLPVLIDKLSSGGAKLLPLNKKVKPIQMMKADSVK